MNGGIECTLPWPVGPIGYRLTSVRGCDVLVALTRDARARCLAKRDAALDDGDALRALDLALWADAYRVFVDDVLDARLRVALGELLDQEGVDLTAAAAAAAGGVR